MSVFLSFFFSDLYKVRSLVTLSLQIFQKKNIMELNNGRNRHALRSIAYVASCAGNKRCLLVCLVSSLAILWLGNDNFTSFTESIVLGEMSGLRQSEESFLVSYLNK